METMQVIKTAALTLMALSFSTAAFAAEPYGTWTRPSTGAQVQFSKCGANLCAKIVGQKDPTKKDTIGKTIMSGAVKSGDNTWKGDLLNTDDGKTYSGVVTLESANALNLKGCAMAGLVCKGETWTRN
jgi:uncharacterized protein (DUF2147 family)